MNADLVKLFIPATVAFCIGILITPILTHYLYKYEMWKKRAGKIGLDGKATEIFNSLHKDKEVGTPKMGGVVIWGSVSLTVLLFWIISRLFPFELPLKFDFLSRSQTWIPLATLLVGALIGLLDDYLDIKGSRDNLSGGLSFKKRLVLVSTVAFVSAMWFYIKLDVSAIGLPQGLYIIFGNIIPLEASFPLGIWFVPFFMLIIIGLYTGGVIDGLDGLAGGVFAAMFAAYGGIAFYQQQLDLAAFCAVIVGGILAFLWFNIPPARFYMAETGSMSLSITLGVVAFMTDSLAGGYGILVLPIIALPLIITSASVVIQLLSKKFRGKKVFLVAPLHHHFEALGWPSSKVVMRYWVISIVFAVLGMVLAMIG